MKISLGDVPVTYKDISSLEENDSIRPFIKAIKYIWAGDNDIKLEEEPIGMIHMYQDDEGYIHLHFTSKFLAQRIKI